MLNPKFESTGISLKAGCVAYLSEHLEKTAKPSTLKTAERTLGLLMEVMGEDKLIENILAVHVNNFYASEQATMLKGKPRATASILQIRRIVRAAIVWWYNEGYLAKLPLPAAEKVIQEKHANAVAKKQAKLEKKAAKQETVVEPHEEVETPIGQELDGGLGDEIEAV